MNRAGQVKSVRDKFQAAFVFRLPAQQVEFYGFNTVIWSTVTLFYLCPNWKKYVKGMALNEHWIQDKEDIQSSV